MMTQETQKLAAELALAVTRTGAAPVKILLVEDNPDDVVVARMAFNKSRIANELYVARDGQEAVDILFGDDRCPSSLNRIHPDLIVLDLGLPRVTGMEVLKKIRESNELSKVAVIMLTASDRPGDMINSDTLGSRAYIQKPIEVGTLIHAIEVLGKLGIVFAELPRSEASG